MNIVTQLFYKWFGLSEPVCETCEVLRDSLARSEAERKELLHRLLEPKQAEPLIKQDEEFVPVTPKFVPWRVRQQMLEQEDKKKAQLLKDREVEIGKLETELGVK
jgi:hypothetical protein